MLGDLTGRTAFVTGASQGIGRGISLVMAEQGAHIVLADIAPEGAHSAARDVERVGRRALVVQADVTRRDSVDAAVGKALDAFGRLDILVNNASVTRAPGYTDLEDGMDTEEDWRVTFAVNVTGRGTELVHAAGKYVEPDVMLEDQVVRLFLEGAKAHVAQGRAK